MADAVAETRNMDDWAPSRAARFPFNKFHL